MFKILIGMMIGAPVGYVLCSLLVMAKEEDDGERCE